LRILHLIPNFTGGGAERQLALLAPELSRIGTEVHVAFCQVGLNSAANFDLFAHSDVKLHHIARHRSHDPTILLRLLKIIRSIKPDLIQTWILQMDVLGGLAARMSGVPFVVSERSSALAYPPTLKHWLRTQVGRFAITIVANSQDGANYWRPWATRIEVIRNGLALDLIRSSAKVEPAVLGLPENARLILCAGRLSPEKNVGTLVEALDKVLTQNPDCIAILFGEGELRQKVQARVELVQARGRIYLHGYTNNLWNWMRRAAAFVSISHFEGSPNAVLEAMAIGCPLVVSSIPQHREILDDSTALFCNPNSVADVSGSICKALNDPSAAAARAEVAQKRSAEWSIEKTAQQYLKLYETLISRQALVA
jgi:glycosyltransferase involved in cell wall biosynthesis